MLNAAFSDECQDADACNDYLACVLGGQQGCEETYPEGFAILGALVFESCGACGDGV